MKNTLFQSLEGIQRCAAATIILFAAAGCATITKGEHQNVSIHSNVEGAEVFLDGQSIGKTPYNGPVKRGDETMLRLEKEGYKTKTITLNTELEPVFWGNIICGGFLGSTTDYSTGSMYRYAPATVNVDLEPIIAKK